MALGLAKELQSHGCVTDAASEFDNLTTHAIQTAGVFLPSNAIATTLEHPLAKLLELAFGEG